VTVANAMFVQNFESASLKHTFPKVCFGTLAAEGNASALPATNPHADSAPAPNRVEIGRVVKASAPNAMTVAVWRPKDVQQLIEIEAFRVLRQKA